MGNRNLHETQLSDAMTSLWIHSDLSKLDLSGETSVFIGHISWESLSLGSAIKDISESIRVIMIWENWWTVELHQWRVIPTIVTWLYDFYLSQRNAPKNPYWLQINPNFRLHWNSPWFKYYSEHKRLTSMILTRFWVRVPEEIEFRYSRMRHWIDPINALDNHDESWELLEQQFPLQYKSDNKKIRDFWQKIWLHRKLVFKPRNWKQWEGVEIWSYGDFEKEFGLNKIPDVFTDDIEEAIIVQEKIQSYPVAINWVQKDWNIRVLVTYDFETSEYRIVWCIWRIDDTWKAVNISQTADYISLEEIWEYAWWESDDLDRIRWKIEDIALKSVQAISERWFRKSKKNWYDSENDFQVLAWVDVIVDEHEEPYVIEVNDSDSWCMYELMKLTDISRLYVLAESIKIKALMSKSVQKINTLLAQELSYDQQRLYCQWKLDLDIIETPEGPKIVLIEK